MPQRPCVQHVVRADQAVVAERLREAYHEDERDERRAHLAQGLGHAAARRRRGRRVQLARRPQLVVAEPRRRTHEHAGKVEAVAQVGEQGWHLRDAHGLLHLVECVDRDELAIAAAPGERRQIHHQDHVHRRDLDRRQRHMVELTHTVRVQHVRHARHKHDPRHVLCSAEAEVHGSIRKERRAQQVHHAAVQLQDAEEKQG